MPTDCIPFRDTQYFSQLICDYLDQNSQLQSFYNRFPSLENFKFQIEEKQQTFSEESRKVLVESLQKQYQGLSLSEETSQHILELQQSNTFTVTTGHQLNIFTGPLYFLYKIVSTINLCKQLKEAYPDHNFVPVYWMATEDHDFDEINYFNFNNKKIVWNRKASGAVGELDTQGLSEVFDIFSKELGVGHNAEAIKQLFEKAYLEHANLASATRYLVNELFGNLGLVIIDANEKALKTQFIPYILKDALDNVAYQKVTETNEKLNTISEGYKIQVNPREINLFYLKESLRERLVFEDKLFKVLNTNITFTKETLEAEIHNHPERFSPNVITRPLYQEVILPNLCYIGGGGELAYWLQLKSFFKAVEVPFPVLLLRNSVLLITAKQKQKLEKLNISMSDLFLKRDAFINKKVRQISNIDIDFSPQKELLHNQFEALYKLAEDTDKSFLGAVNAQEVKQIKGLEHLEKRLLKAQKKKLADHVVRITDLQNQLFPNYSLQERNVNFSQFYVEYGKSLITTLLSELQPLKGEFFVVELP